MPVSSPARPDAAARKMVEDTVPAWVRLAVEKRNSDARWQEGDKRPALAVLYAPWDPEPRAANKTRGKHWGQRAHESEDAAVVALWTMRAAGEPMFAIPVDVETLVFRAAEMDDDNAISGLKPLRDHLVRRGLLPDDSPQWWRNAGVWMHANSAYRQAWTVLIVRERADPVAEQLEELYTDAGAEIQEGGTVDWQWVEQEAARLRKAA